MQRIERECIYGKGCEGESVREAPCNPTPCPGKRLGGAHYSQNEWKACIKNPLPGGFSRFFLKINLLLPVVYKISMILLLEISHFFVCFVLDAFNVCPLSLLNWNYETEYCQTNAIR